MRYFKTKYNAGFDAGKNGVDKWNTRYSFFLTRDNMREWQRGYDEGIKKQKTKPKKNSA